ncbi:DUF1127 domain-containing protein [Salipiger sp. P9]|uniref:DUF1127 domain-containing protein n=1 Tax=Salipiger pentaromativorans TaxID=2943193 RepID=UPI00215806E4|nr:DUF1127 domain-containing protein [Salipiger pentaromativorans]MCR8546539.1 DUF1127 domain-containing protein [Salipiger pentaromativorans]
MIRDTALPCPARRARRPLLTRILTWQALYRQRRRLADLDAAALRDLGISRHDAEYEAQRPFWDAPESWRR